MVDQNGEAPFGKPYGETIRAQNTNYYHHTVRLLGFLLVAVTLTPSVGAAQRLTRSTVEKWEVYQSVDPITDDRVIQLDLASDEGTTLEDDPFLLSIWCEEKFSKSVNVKIWWGSDVETLRTDIITRFGSDEPETTEWRKAEVFLVTSSIVMGMKPPSPSDFTVKLLDYDRFVARVETENDGTRTGVWDTTGFDRAIADHLETCGLVE